VKKRSDCWLPFGGGARARKQSPLRVRETARTCQDLIPQAILYASVNHGILGHYVATASLATVAMNGESLRSGFRRSIRRFFRNIFEDLKPRRGCHGLVHQQRV